MYSSIDEFIKDWKSESEATIKIFKALSDESLRKGIKGYKRTIGDLAWHITGSIGEIMRSAGFTTGAFDESDNEPETAERIAEDYKKYSDSLAEMISEEWSDAALKDKVNMFGEMWSKGKLLKVIVIHQIHHRAQITVLMRLTGLKVPGIYGPSYEEWEQYGMPPAK